jgi:hypothetical protein
VIRIKHASLRIVDSLRLAAGSFNSLRMIHAGVPEKVAAMTFSGRKTRLLFDRCSSINEACLRTAAGTIISLHKEVQERPNRIHRHILGTMWDRLRKKSPRKYGRKLLKTNRCVQTESHALCFEKLILIRQSPSLTRERVRVTAGPSPLVGSPMYLGEPLLPAPCSLPTI